jgi:Fe-Mn family superoxide dismutase
MEIHHDKHHAAYVGNLNRALSQAPDFYFESKQRGATEHTLGDLLKNLGSVPEKIRPAIKNNGGGHYNHALFWQLMKKDGGGEPKGELADAITTAFGSFAAFKDQFSRTALGQFGSGWAWLILDSQRLKIEALPNQDSPLSSGQAVVLGIDVWEHAYYLKYQNKRADYISAWFNVINWDFATDRYRALKA